jgi:hypothetical protein
LVFSFDLLKMQKKDGQMEPPTKRVRQLLERVAGQCRVGRGTKARGRLGFSFDLLKIQKKGVPKELPPKRVRLE